MANQVAGLSELSYLILGTSSMLLMMLSIIAFVVVFQRKLAKKAKAYSDIEKLMQQHELQSAYLLIRGQEQERKRIAAELHDNIGGLLATLKIYSDLSLSKEEAAAIRRLNTKINEISGQLGDEVRKLSHEFDLRTLSGFGLKVAVQHLCEAISSSGKIKITHVIDIIKPIDEEKSLDLYRIIQELFTNTLKHAQAAHVRLEITQIDEEITFIFEDDGHGFDSKTIREGMGLQNIRSRVNRMDGKLTMDSTAKGSTYIIEINQHD
jgi:two-component system, NarL family, sensor kinase